MPDPQLEATPSGRLGLRARQIVELVDKRINEHRTAEQKTSYPFAPSASDFAEMMDLEVEQERLLAQIEIAELYSESHAFVLKHELSKVEWKIAMRAER